MAATLGRAPSPPAQRAGAVSSTKAALKEGFYVKLLELSGSKWALLRSGIVALLRSRRDQLFALFALHVFYLRQYLGLQGSNGSADVCNFKTRTKRKRDRH